MHAHRIRKFYQLIINKVLKLRPIRHQFRVSDTKMEVLRYLQKIIRLTQLHSQLMADKPIMNTILFKTYHLVPIAYQLKMVMVVLPKKKLPSLPPKSLSVFLPHLQMHYVMARVQHL